MLEDWERVNATDEVPNGWTGVDTEAIGEEDTTREGIVGEDDTTLGEVERRGTAEDRDCEDVTTTGMLTEVGERDATEDLITEDEDTTTGVLTEVGRRDATEDRITEDENTTTGVLTEVAEEVGVEVGVEVEVKVGVGVGVTVTVVQMVDVSPEIITLSRSIAASA